MSTTENKLSKTTVTILLLFLAALIVVPYQIGKRHKVAAPPAAAPTATQQTSGRVTNVSVPASVPQPQVQVLPNVNHMNFNAKFTPKDDITTPELAKIFELITSGKELTPDVYQSLGTNVTRHLTITGTNAFYVPPQPAPKQ